MFVQGYLRAIIRKLSNWYYSLFGSEATEQDIQEYFAQCEAEDRKTERQQQEAERNLQEYLAERRAEEEEIECENLEYRLGWRWFEDREDK